MGGMAHDMMRSVDVLLGLGKPFVDPKRIILLGAVAGGGDPAAVTAALDQRIAAAVPFNFGGPQPETKYPLPADGEDWFNYAGGGSWESTRNLAFSARDGFLPWVIVGSLAPRGLIYAHEFAWDKERDPVWKRLEKIYTFYDAPDGLSFAHGKGSVRGTSKDDTHCNNIGAVHRKPIYPMLDKWFAMAPPAKETQTRRPTEDLLCAPKGLPPLHALASQLGAERAAAARAQRDKLSAEKSRLELRRTWDERLGGAAPAVWTQTEKVGRLGDVTCIRAVLTSDGDVAVPLVLLLPKAGADTKSPVVVALAQHGKAAFLKNRADVIAGL